MKKNMGLTDRVLRSGVAIMLIAMVTTGTVQGTLAIVLSVLATVFLLTSLVSVCPAYMPFGISTIRKQLHNKTN